MGDNDFSSPMAISESDVVFGEATPEQRRISWQLNSASWAVPLTTEQYMEELELLSRTDLSRDGGERCWVLYLKSDPFAIVASCETIRKTVFIRRPKGSDGGGCGGGVEDGGPVIEEAPAYGIASVYTNPAYRRLGMASLLLQKLQEFMDAEPAACSILYSDIGRQYYSMIGWSVFPHSEAWLILLKDGHRLAPNSCCDVKIRFLTRDEIKPLCEADEANLKARLSKIREDGKTHIAFAPNYAQVDWKLVKEEFMARKLFNKELKRRGAITVDGKSWAYWDHDWKRKQLRIMSIVTMNPQSEARRVDHIWALLGAAVAEASEWGLKTVVVWNPDESTTSGIKATSNAYENDVKVMFKERDRAIPSLRWRGAQDTKRTVWEENYYYSWC